MGAISNQHEARANQFFSKGKADFQEGKFESCIRDLQYAQHLFQTLNSKELAAESMFILSHAYLNLNQKQYALTSFNEAMFKFKELNNLVKAGECALKIGAIHRESGETSKSEDFLSMSAKIFSELKDIEKTADAWKEMGNTFQKEADLDSDYFHKTEDAYKQAIELYKKGNCKEKKALTELDLALLMINQMKYKESEKLLVSSFKHFKSTKDEDFVVTIAIQLVRVYLQLNKKKQARQYYTIAVEKMKAAGYSANQIEQIQNMFG